MTSSTISGAAGGLNEVRYRLGLFADRRFKYLIVWPAILVLLLIGLFPLVYNLVVGFQNITMLEEDTSFAGLANYARLFGDLRLWPALGHTATFTPLGFPVA